MRRARKYDALRAMISSNTIHRSFAMLSQIFFKSLILLSDDLYQIRLCSLLFHPYQHPVLMAVGLLGLFVRLFLKNNLRAYTNLRRYACSAHVPVPYIPTFPVPRLSALYTYFQGICILSPRCSATRFAARPPRPLKIKGLREWMENGQAVGKGCVSLS